MQRKTLDASGPTAETEAVTWYSFPKEVKDQLSEILSCCMPGTDDEEALDAGNVLLDVEYSFRESGTPFPWAIVFYPKEYPVAGHVLAVRPNRDIRFFCYSLMDRQRFNAFDPAVQGAPPMSIAYMYSKSALMHSKVADSPIFRQASEILADKAEDRHWVVFVDPLDEHWIQQARATNVQLFRELSAGLGDS